MGKLLMLAGCVVAPEQEPEMLSAYVVQSGNGGPSRLFKVTGKSTTPEIVELDPATTINLQQFRDQVRRDVQPALDSAAGSASATEPDPAWVCELVQQFLEGQD